MPIMAALPGGAYELPDFIEPASIRLIWLALCASHSRLGEHVSSGAMAHGSDHCTPRAGPALRKSRQKKRQKLLKPQLPKSPISGKGPAESSMLSSLLGLDQIRNQQFGAHHIDPFLRQVLKHCRNSHVHAEARELVPLSELLENNLDILDDDGLYQDKLLPLVVEWFKSSFFVWFEAPNCENCSSELNHTRTYENAEQKRVEAYKCDRTGCDYEYEFIRHNDPAILLHTRRGRCGEWAICFLVILRSLDYHARIVYDSTDHVWNEVWSEPERRWIHVDPCEGIVDVPLIYEAGWGKELVYCLAFGQYEVLDVTGRYVINFKDTLDRRKECDEDWLTAHLQEITEGLLVNASDEMRLQVRLRHNMDLDYLRGLTSKPQVVPDKSKLSGRKTGGFEWRLKRGEYRVAAKSEFLIKVSAGGQTDDGPIFSLAYNCDRNAYECTDSVYSSKGWSSIVYEYENIDYKYERDWKTSYLSRYESCPAEEVGKIRWRFDLSSLNDQWQKIEVFVRAEIYPNTNITLQLESYTDISCPEANKSIRLKPNELCEIKRTEAGGPIIDLSARLTGGNDGDEVAWQKPQLFRQTRGKDAHEWPLSFKIL